MSAENLYFDTLVHDALALDLLVKRQGISQLVAGIDDPYPLGEMETVPGSYPGKVIDDALKLDLISPEDAGLIWFENVVQWLYGDEQESFLKRIAI